MNSHVVHCFCTLPLSPVLLSLQVIIVSVTFSTLVRLDLIQTDDEHVSAHIDTHNSTLWSYRALWSLSPALPGLFEFFCFPLISLSDTPTFLRALQFICFHISLTAALGVQAAGISECMCAGSASPRAGGGLCREIGELSTRDPAPAEPT